MSNPAWLPQKLDQAAHADESALEAAAWTIFQRDFASQPSFRGKSVAISRQAHPARSDRGFTYWHCVTEGTPERTRTQFIVERLERVPWIRPLIENEACPQSAIKVWSNQRDDSTHVCVWFDRINYLVVLAIVKSGFLLKTAYTPERKRCHQLHKEYARWKKSGARL